MNLKEIILRAQIENFQKYGTYGIAAFCDSMYKRFEEGNGRLPKDKQELLDFIATNEWMKEYINLWAIKYPFKEIRDNFTTCRDFAEHILNYSS
jgi:hypothetical protein